MIVLDTHIWVRWLDPTAAALPIGLVDRIETAEVLAINVEVAPATHESPLPPRGGGVGGEGSGHDFHDRGCLEKS